MPDVMRDRMSRIIEALERGGESNYDLIELAKRVRDYFDSLDQPTSVDDYRKAMNSQDACNLSGIVFEFGEVMHRICKEARDHDHGTDWRNQHPICRLYAEQICHLTRDKGYFKAASECEKRTR